MKLSDEQANKVISHISKVSGNKPIICPICGCNSWKLTYDLDGYTLYSEFMNPIWSEQLGFL